MNRLRAEIEPVSLADYTRFLFAWQHIEAAHQLTGSDGLQAIVTQLDGLELHLKEGPKNIAERQYRRDNEHLDAAAGVAGIEAFYEQCVANGISILRPLTATEWGTKDFYIEDPDGYVISFGGRPSA